ncbi:TetR/AcrR family transcriptional regulator [Streptomyces albiaxialis]|uniref:TetR/AcrR family transcriptional regulator n=1 Tax=Streptomyces albiaxialis TaxID=329523 RepID=A0ABN2WUN6_9ACTN
MGHREQLMAGAKRCLEERGYARTTSRDIAAAANNAPVGTINYHYGSKEALLNAALLEVVHEWGDRVSHAAGTADERYWQRVAAPGDEDRPVLVAALEAQAEAERTPEIRRQIAEAYAGARAALSAELYGIEDPDEARAVGSVHMALTAGLTQQWLIDPDSAPSGADVVRALRALADHLADG